MAWRLAKSLEKLREQVNARAPNLSKASDGTIGDAAHASRTSDHNPWIKDGNTRVVSALDITHDPARGCDSYKLAQSLVASRDPRIKYVISNGQIASKAKAWAWRKYTGKNPHSMHVHVSVESTKGLYDATGAWTFSLDAPHGNPPPIADNPLLRQGSRGSHVKRAQGLLNGTGAKPPLAEDGDFGVKTERAVKAFQRKNGLVADGVVGAYTWAKLDRSV